MSTIATLKLEMWGRVALTTGPVAPKADTFGAPSSLPTLGTPLRGRFRTDNRKDR